MDKYTIELITINGFTIHNWYTVDWYGVVELVGPYCLYPKTEPRYFEISYNA